MLQPTSLFKHLFVLVGMILIPFTGVFSQMNFATPINDPFNYLGGGINDRNSNFVDIDGDGDKDYFRNTSLYGIQFVENIGNAAHPVFIVRGNGAFGIRCMNSLCYKDPPLFFADIDNDGDQDAISGFTLHENIGSATNPSFITNRLFFDKVFELRLRYNNMFDIAESDFIVGATLVDIDGDGDLDFFAGGFFEDAPLYFARNTGSATNPKFTAEANNPFGLNNTASEKFPVFLDFDNDNDLDVVIGFGNMAGPGSGLTFFKNIGSKTNPNFTNIGNDLYGFSMPTGTDYGLVAFADIDNDGDIDAFLPGTPSKFYRNTIVNTNAGLLPQTIQGFDAVPTLTAGKQVYTITGVSGSASGNPIKYVSADPSIVQVIDSTLVPLKGGIAKVYAIQLGNSSYQAGFAEQPVTVVNPTKTVQTITGFDTIPILAIGDTFNITGVTGGASGNPVVFTSSVPPIAKVKGNKVIAISRGYAEITASQAGNLDYSPATPVVKWVQVGASKIAQKINGFPNTGAIPDLYPGQSFTITGVTGGLSGNPVEFSISKNDTMYVSLVGNTITALRPKSGNIIVAANQLGDSIYENADYTSSRFRVLNNPTKFNQTITGFTITNPLDPETTVDLSGVTGGSSGNPIVFTPNTNDTNQVAINGKTVTFKEAGIFFITATQAGSSTHNPATPVIKGVTVKLRGSKQYQQITNFVIPSIQVVGNTYTITGTTGGASGNPIIYYSSDTSVVSVNGNVLTMLKKGEAIITAMQNGNASFYPAVRKSITVYVKNKVPLTQAITGFGPIPDQIVGDTYTVTGVTGGASGYPIEFRSYGVDINNNELTVNKVGTFQIIAEQQGDGENYLPAPIQTQTVKVGKIPQVIKNLPTINRITIGGIISLNAVTGGASGNPLLITSNDSTIATIAGKTIKGINWGTTKITIWQVGDERYENAKPVVITVLVDSSTTLLPQTIAGFNAIPNLYIGNTYTIKDVIGGASGNPIIYTSSNAAVASVSGNVITAISSGTATITATQAGNSTYLPATTVSQNVIVNSTLHITYPISNNGNPVINVGTVEIYPNPTHDVIYVKLPQVNQPSNASFTLYNGTGLIAKRFNKFSPVNKLYKLNVSDLPSGVYFLNINDTALKLFKKIVINR